MTYICLVKLIKEKDMKNLLREFLDFQESNPQIKNNQELVDSFTATTDYIGGLTWSKQDIRGHAEHLEIEITEAQVQDVADLLTNSSDAEIGINWDVIASRIHEVVGQ